MQDRVVKFVVANSKITEKRYRELMFRTGELARDIGTVLVGRDAVAEGLMDGVGGLAEAMSQLAELVRQREAGYRRAEQRHGGPGRGPRRRPTGAGSKAGGAGEPGRRGPGGGRRGGASGAPGGAPVGDGKAGRRGRGG